MEVAEPVVVKLRYRTFFIHFGQVTGRRVIGVLSEVRVEVGIRQLATRSCLVSARESKRRRPLQRRRQKPIAAVVRKSGGSADVVGFRQAAGECIVRVTHHRLASCSRSHGLAGLIAQRIVRVFCDGAGRIGLLDKVAGDWVIGPIPSRFDRGPHRARHGRLPIRCALGRSSCIENLVGILRDDASRVRGCNQIVVGVIHKQQWIVVDAVLVCVAAAGDIFRSSDVAVGVVFEEEYRSRWIGRNDQRRLAVRAGRQYIGPSIWIRNGIVVTCENSYYVIEKLPRTT